jgi:hypothetical protein
MPSRTPKSIALVASVSYREMRIVSGGKDRRSRHTITDVSCQKNGRNLGDSFF